MKDDEQMTAVTAIREIRVLKALPPARPSNLPDAEDLDVPDPVDAEVGDSRTLDCTPTTNLQVPAEGSVVVTWARPWKSQAAELWLLNW